MVTIKKSILEGRINDFEDAVTAAGVELYCFKESLGNVVRRWLRNLPNEEVSIPAIALAIDTFLRDEFINIIAGQSQKDKYAGSLDHKLACIIEVAKNRLIMIDEAWSVSPQFYLTIYGEMHNLLKSVMEGESDEVVKEALEKGSFC